jgi:hypothetical protein
MTQQVKVEQNGHNKRVFDWNPITRELTRELGPELMTYRLTEDNQFVLIARRPKKAA